jgi:cytoskeletal protein RodZ
MSSTVTVDVNRKKEQSWTIVSHFCLGIAVFLGINAFMMWTAVVANAQQQTASEIVQTTIASWTGLISALAAIAAVIAKWADSQANKHKENTRWLQFAEYANMAKDSLKSTDQSVKDNADLIKNLANVLGNVPPIKTELEKPQNQAVINEINKNVDDWTRDLQKYYEIASKVTELNAKDPVVKKIADVQSFLTPVKSEG